MTRSNWNTRLALVVCAFAAPIAIALPAFAGPHEIKLADPTEAATYCNMMGEYDIAAIAGEPGMSQYGHGYQCKQGIETGPSVTDAIEAGKGECHLATAEEAKPVCPSMGQLDIAVIQGKPAMSQYGQGYDCKQQVETGPSLTNGICQ